MANFLIILSFWLALGALLVGCAVSLISGLRGFRGSGFSRRCIALIIWGFLLATMLCIGPLGFYYYTREIFDRTLQESQEVQNKLLAKLESF